MTKRSGWVGISADELDALLKAINAILIVEGQALELRARLQLDGDHDGRRGALTPRASGSAAHVT